MYTKGEIFNLALGALLLQKRVVNPDTDPSNEAKVLLTHWDAALRITLADLDLDGTSTQVSLELYEEDPNDQWSFAYKYPTRCAFLRRIVPMSGVRDKRSTQVKKLIRMHEGKKVILTNEADAIAEIVDIDTNINSFSAPAGMALAYRLAILGSPLIVGKGAAKLREELQGRYVIAKAEAQALDRQENFIFAEDDEESEFVEERMS